MKKNYLISLFIIILLSLYPPISTQVKLPHKVDGVKSITEITYKIKNNEVKKIDTTTYYKYNIDNLIIETQSYFDSYNKYIYKYNGQNLLEKLIEVSKKDNEIITSTLYFYNKDNQLTSERSKSKYVAGSHTKQYYYNNLNQLIRVDEPYNGEVCISTTFNYYETGELKEETKTYKYGKSQNSNSIYDKCGNKIDGKYIFIEACSYKHIRNRDSIKVDTTFIDTGGEIYKNICFYNESKKTDYLHDSAGKLKKVDKYVFSHISGNEPLREEILYNENGSIKSLYKSYYFFTCIHSKPNLITYTKQYEYYDNGMLKRILHFDEDSSLSKEIFYEITYWN